MKLTTSKAIENIYSFDNEKIKETGFWQIPELVDLEEIQIHIDRLKDIKTIALIGIGGSMLGPQVLLDVFYKHNKTAHTLDNVDPDQAEFIYSQIDPRETHFIIQSKSGRTTEIVSHYSKVRELLEEHGLKASEHITFVTDPVNGYFRSESAKFGIPALSIPPEVGGRFSVMTPIGIFLVGLLGADIKELMNGYKKGREEYLEDSYGSSQKIATQYLEAYKEDKNIIVFMTYSWRLRRFANWLTQLFSESLGKKLDLDGNVVEVGSTPVPAVGVTDQHSQLQLFQEGPRDKVITFISHGYENNYPTGESQDHPHVSSRPFAEVIAAELQGTIQSIDEDGRDWNHISMEICDEHNLGKLFFLFQSVIELMAQVWHIDAYNQPGVERSKDIAYSLLQD